MLLLDNCEHVVDAAAQAVELLLHASPAMRMLATSQEPLGVEGECIYRLSPLEVPATFAAADGEAMQHGAVRLFVARARAADPHFQLDEQTGPAVVQIVRQLDGMPLAIELAAARVAALGVEGLAQRLGDRFRLLAGGRRTALPRHQTVRAALDWSFGLLSEAEQTVLRRLSVFAGGFSLEGAGAVAAGGTLSAEEVIEHVIDLVGRSLIAVDTGGPGPRYRLLETTRLYALEKLAASGEFDPLARSHALYCKELAEAAEAAMRRLSATDWLATYGPEIDNLRQAIEWALGPGGDRALGLELSAIAGMLWSLVSLTAEGRARIAQALAAIDADTPKWVEARLWRNAAFLTAGHPKEALPAAERAVALHRELGNSFELARALDQLGLTLARLGRAEEAEAALRESCALFAAAGQQGMNARSLTSLGIARMFAGRLPEAKRLLSEAIIESGGNSADYWGLRALIYLAWVEFGMDEVEQAVARGRLAVTLCRSQRRTALLGQALCFLAGYLLEKGEMAEASAALREGLPLARERDIGGIVVAIGMYHMAGIAALERQFDRAASLFGYAEAYFAREFGTTKPADRRDIARLHACLADTLAPAALARFKAVGAAWTEDQAMREALAA
jgi:predicted ATPase